MEILFTIAAFLLLIGIVITIHEGGHFLIGRWCGIKMMEFSIGFGPKIYQKRFGKDNTLFTLRLLPLGGFVKPFDKSAVSEDEWKSSSIEEKNRSFSASARWKKVLMVAGGPFSNFVLAFIVYFIAMSFVGTKGVEPVIAEVLPNSVFAQAGVTSGEKVEKVNGNNVRLLSDAYPLIVNGLIQGQKMNLTTDKGNYQLDFSKVDLKDITNDLPKTLGVYFNGSTGDVVVERVVNDSPAFSSGLKEGDKILSVNNLLFNNIDRAITYINQNPGKELSFDVERNNEKLTLPITPKAETIDGKDIGRIGVVFQLTNVKNVQTVKYPMAEAFWNSTVKVWDMTYTTIISIKKLVMGELSTKAISGPLSIADYSGKSAQHGLFQYMLMIGAISVAIGVFNLLPIPALDGGHLAQYAIESVIGKDINPKFIHYGQVIGFGLIMGIFALSISNDLIRYVF